MKLLRLRLENFRSFAEADLDFNADGLIGIRGPNGAGKSSLFEAIEFALYGKRPSEARMGVRRDGAPAGAPCSVRVDFEFDGCQVTVARSEDRASLLKDGREVVRELRATTTELERLLGLNREQFTATFYARQREVQSFARVDRKRRIEELLGLTRVREAARFAREDGRHQEAVVRALQERAADLDAAKALVSLCEAQAAEFAPAAEAARKARDALAAARGAAWQALTEARGRAKRAYEAEREAAVAGQRAEAATQRRDETAQMLQSACKAAAELRAVAPEAARLAELEARVRDQELQRLAVERAQRLRASIAEAEAGSTRLAVELARAPEPAPTPDALRCALAEAERQLEERTARLLALAGELSAASEEWRRGEEALRKAARGKALDEQMAELASLRDKAEPLGAWLLRLEGDRIETERRLAQAREHRDDAVREGRDARCPHCLRPYGEQHEDVLTALEKELGALEVRRGRTRASLELVREEQRQLTASLEAFGRLEAERALLSVPVGALPDVEALARRVGDLEAERGHSIGAREAMARQIVELKAGLESAVARESARRDLAGRLAREREKGEALARDLAELPPGSYDADAHEQTRALLEKARRAEARCVRLRPKAEEVGRFERRLAVEQEAMATAAGRAKELKAVAAARHGDQNAFERAEAKVGELDEQLRVAGEGLAEAEQRVLRDRKDLEAARQALERTLGERAQLADARQELRYQTVTADLLKAYATDAQRRTFPALEKETAELLARLSSSKYGDVRLDDNADVLLLADGEHRPLKRFSGGEQDLTNVCLRLALSRTLARQRGTDAGLVILDEVFGSQDLDHRKALLDQLRELERDFRQVFVVSHFDDVVAVCDVQVDVERVDGVSCATVSAQ